MYKRNRDTKYIEKDRINRNIKRKRERKEE
jgi:hypothetical protein